MATPEAVPPGTRPTPLIGDIREFSGDPLGFLTRLHPVAPMLSRKVNTMLRARGYEFGPDADVWVSPYVTHRDPRRWPEPGVFRPDRWLDGSTDDLPATPGSPSVADRASATADGSRSPRRS